MNISYEERRQALIEYLRVKADEGDWHAVSDVANDLRELEAAQQAQPRPSLRIGE